MCCDLLFHVGVISINSIVYCAVRFRYVVSFTVFHVFFLYFLSYVFSAIKDAYTFEINSKTFHKKHLNKTIIELQIYTHNTDIFYLAKYRIYSIPILSFISFSCFIRSNALTNLMCFNCLFLSRIRMCIFNVRAYVY